MNQRVTIQDIADALSLSRTTVSKAINNTGIISDETRKRVLQKAAELGYKQFSYFDMSSLDDNKKRGISKGSQQIVLLTISIFGGDHFAVTMLDKLQREAASCGYGFVTYRLLPEELEQGTLPKGMNLDETAGIICVEMFHAEYNSMLCSLGKPILFVDAPVIAVPHFVRQFSLCDFVFMENRRAMYEFVWEMQGRGCKSFGFIGDILHCLSFYERYVGLLDALRISDIPFDERYLIDAREDGILREDYFEKLEADLLATLPLPDVYVCANDYIALVAINILRKHGYSVPEDVMFLGFDDSSNARTFSPTLSTVHIHSQSMGVTCMNLLLTRIKEPSFPTRTTYVETELIYRESTGD